MKRKRKLKKLSRGGKNFSRTTLYEAEDHLLLVDGYYVEQYRRFFYPDIEAVFWIPSRATMAGWILMLIVLSVAGWGILQIGDSAAVVGFSMVCWIPAVMVFGYIANTLRTGGFCRMYLSTAAQQIQVPGVSTAAKARKLIRLLDRKTSASPLPSAESEPPSRDA